MPGITLDRWLDETISLHPSRSREQGLMCECAGATQGFPSPAALNKATSQEHVAVGPRYDQVDLATRIAVIPHTRTSLVYVGLNGLPSPLVPLPESPHSLASSQRSSLRIDPICQLSEACACIRYAFNLLFPVPVSLRDSACFVSFVSSPHMILHLNGTGDSVPMRPRYPYRWRRELGREQTMSVRYHAAHHVLQVQNPAAFR